MLSQINICLTSIYGHDKSCAYNDDENYFFRKTKVVHDNQSNAHCCKLMMNNVVHIKLNKPM